MLTSACSRWLLAFLGLYLPQCLGMYYRFALSSAQRPVMKALVRLWRSDACGFDCVHTRTREVKPELARLAAKNRECYRLFGVVAP